MPADDTNHHDNGSSRGATLNEPPADPRGLLAEEALSSNDPGLQLIGRALSLLTLLVPCKVALFHAVNTRLEKYAAEPIVARFEPPRPGDLDELLTHYRNAHAGSDPFAPHRFARTIDRVVTPDSLDAEGRTVYERYGHRVPSRYGLVPAATMFLRARGQIIAAITLARTLQAPQLSPSDAAVLRRAQPLIELSYTLASGQGLPAPSADPVHDQRLTLRERDIADLLVQGASNQEIAHALQITPATVKTHVRHILAKLGVANRRQARHLLNLAAGAG